jgi:hypothetical protein
MVPLLGAFFAMPAIAFEAGRLKGEHDQGREPVAASILERLKRVHSALMDGFGDISEFQLESVGVDWAKVCEGHRELDELLNDLQAGAECGETSPPLGEEGEEKAAYRCGGEIAGISLWSGDLRNREGFDTYLHSSGKVLKGQEERFTREQAIQVATRFGYTLYDRATGERLN